jgi:hypothetical protein
VENESAKELQERYKNANSIALLIHTSAAQDALLAKK